MTYDNWQGRIAQYDFLENQDFLVVTEKKVTMTDAPCFYDFVWVPQFYGTQKASGQRG